MFKKLRTTSVIAVVFAAACLGVAITPSTPAHAADCDDNAVVRCGVYSLSEMRTNYKGDVKVIYNYFGMTDSMISGTGVQTKEGYVTKSGDVVVDGTVVATDAVSAGRQYKPGSTKVVKSTATFYTRPTTVSFNVSKINAFIFVDNTGKFLGAVLKDCGNPIKATPKVVPKPAAACTNVKGHKISRTEYTFTATASTSNGATISSYTFTVSGPSTSKHVVVTTTSKTATTPTVSLKNPGTYTIYVTVKTSVGDRTSGTCNVRVTVDKEPTPEPEKVTVCNPTTGVTITVDKNKADQYKPIGDVACQPKVETTTTTKGEPVQTIASTGPVDYLVGTAGLGSLTAASYYLHVSRRRIADALRKQ